VLVGDANASNNTNAGIRAEGNVNLAITRSTVTGNYTGIYSGPDSTIYTYGDNRVLGNNDNVFGLTSVSGS
jgi:hypothetical protein